MAMTNDIDGVTREHRMAAFLNHKFLEWMQKGGRPRSQADFTRWLGVPPTSYSNWINESRLPVGENVHKLAAKLGPQVYDIVGIPRLMPVEPKVKFLVDAWFDGTLNDADKAEIMAIAMRGDKEIAGSM